MPAGGGWVWVGVLWGLQRASSALVGCFWSPDSPRRLTCSQESFPCPLHNSLSWVQLGSPEGSCWEPDSCAPDPCLQDFVEVGPGRLTPGAGPGSSPRGVLATTTPRRRPLTPGSLHRLYLGNPMDPPDLLSVELSASRPPQHLGRVKSKSPPPSWRPRVHWLPRGTILSGQL